MLESPTTAPPAAGARAGLVTGVVVGVASAALGLGVAELVAGFLGRTATPVIAVGEAFIDRVPGWLKDLAVAWFGTADKAVLIAGVLVVFAVLSAGIGVLTTRRRGAGAALREASGTGPHPQRRRQAGPGRQTAGGRHGGRSHAGQPA